MNRRSKKPETDDLVSQGRVFKTKWFARAAVDADISDAELCAAIAEVMQGQADDLGGGVWKKRLLENRYRSIILAKAKKVWIYAYLFAKKDRANIDNKELSGFKKLANSYSKMSAEQLATLSKAKELMEICHDCTD